MTTPDGVEVKGPFSEMTCKSYCESEQDRGDTRVQKINCVL